MSQSSPGATYESAGVSIEAGDKAVELMRVWVDKARRPEMIGGIGGFAGLFDASALKAYDQPLLASSADGVGTKVAIAQALDKHDTIGFDLVGMLVDDLVVCGAEPLFLTDYIATGRVVPETDRGDRQGHRRGLRDRRLRSGGRRDRRAPRPAGARRVRRRRVHHRRGRGQPAPRPRPGPSRGRRHRDGLERAALQRLLAGASRPSRAGQAPSRRARRRPRAHPGRGAARADPHLRQGLPRAGQADRDPCDVPHHRRRPGRQPRAGPPGRAHRLARPVDLVAAARLRPGRRDRRGGARGPREDPELWRRDGLADRGRRRRPGGGRARRASASTPGSRGP